MMGASSLCQLDLLTLLIGTGSKKRGVKELAAELLGNHGIESLGRLRPQELMLQSGVGLGTACRIAAAFELGRRWHQTLEQERCTQVRIHSSSDAIGVFRSMTVGSEVENLLVMGLDARRQVLFVDRVAVGGINRCGALPCDVFRLAVRSGASGVIVAHNHPSGSDEPSPDDFLFTERLRQASETVGVELVDHLVVGRGDYFSFADHSMIYG